MPTSLVPPLMPPYGAETEAMLRRWMPPGAPFEPLALFRSMAKNEDLMAAMRALGSYFLGSRSPLSVRLREMLILRTCAGAACEYEWGVHVTAFADAAGLSRTDIREVSTGAADSPRWSSAEQAALLACDQLSASANLGEAARQALARHYDEREILALITLVSWYRLIAALANTVCEQSESWAARFADYPKG